MKLTQTKIDKINLKIINKLAIFTTGICLGLMVTPTTRAADLSNSPVSLQSNSSVISTAEENLKPSNIWLAGFSGSGNVNLNLDPVTISKEIDSAVRRSRNREGFVKNIMNQAFYNWGKQRYNVMVFNLSHNYQHRFRGVKYYGTANYHGITYGIWIFESGTFKNQGDGGWINWAFRGWFDRNGKFVKFRSR